MSFTTKAFQIIHKVAQKNSNIFFFLCASDEASEINKKCLLHYPMNSVWHCTFCLFCLNAHSLQMNSIEIQHPSTLKMKYDK